MTERGAPHRETAQAPLCRFGRGLRVQSQALALSVCGKNHPPARHTRHGDVYRFGPLRSVIPYSCVLVDLCMKKLQRAGEPESSNSRNPFPPLFSLGSGSGPPPKWARSSFYISRGYHMHLSPPKLDCSSLHNWTETGTVAVRVPF